jgi:hypothetical protein
MGMNLTIGIAIAFGVFFDKIFGTLAEKSTPLLAVWFPILFSEY